MRNNLENMLEVSLGSNRLLVVEFAMKVVENNNCLRFVAVVVVLVVEMIVVMCRGCPRVDFVGDKFRGRVFLIALVLFLCFVVGSQVVVCLAFLEDKLRFLFLLDLKNRLSLLRGFLLLGVA